MVFANENETVSAAIQLADPEYARVGSGEALFQINHFVDAGLRFGDGKSRSLGWPYRVVSGAVFAVIDQDAVGNDVLMSLGSAPEMLATFSAGHALLVPVLVGFEAGVLRF